MTANAAPSLGRDDRTARAERRAFVRRHHPDLGGDVRVFVEGLAALRRSPAQRPVVTVYRSRSVGRRLTRRWRAVRRRVAGRPVQTLL